MSGVSGWVGVDLDGTLAKYNKFVSATHIGDPIPRMVKRVKRWIEAGIDVRIFTARISHDSTLSRILEAEQARDAITAWCIEHLGFKLPITNVKDYHMIELWDDRAITVEKNTGLKIMPVSCIEEE